MTNDTGKGSIVDALKSTEKLLRGIRVPTELIEEIGFPLLAAVKNLVVIRETIVKYASEQEETESCMTEPIPLHSEAEPSANGES